MKGMNILWLFSLILTSSFAKPVHQDKKQFQTSCTYWRYYLCNNMELNMRELSSNKEAHHRQLKDVRITKNFTTKVSQYLRKEDTKKSKVQQLNLLYKLLKLSVE